MNYKNVFNPVIPKGKLVDLYFEASSRNFPFSKEIRLNNGKTLKADMKIKKYKGYKDISNELTAHMYSVSRKLTFVFIPSNMSKVLLSFQLFNRKGQRISDFEWEGYYFDLSSLEKQDTLKAEVSSAIHESLIEIVNHPDTHNQRGNLAYLDIMGATMNNLIEIGPDEEDPNRMVYTSDGIKINTHKENLLIQEYLDLVSKANSDLEDMNLNLYMIQISNVLSGQIEKTLERNSYDPAELIQRSPTMNAIWGDEISEIL